MCHNCKYVKNCAARGRRVIFLFGLFMCPTTPLGGGAAGNANRMSYRPVIWHCCHLLIKFWCRRLDFCRTDRKRPSPRPAPAGNDGTNAMAVFCLRVRLVCGTVLQNEDQCCMQGRWVVHILFFCQLREVFPWAFWDFIKMPRRFGNFQSFLVNFNENWLAMDIGGSAKRVLG